MVKPGAAVVGAGTIWEGRKLLSDVDEDVAEVAGWITPRLGGVGPMTRAMLLRNAVAAAERAPGVTRRRRTGSRPTSAPGAATRSSTTTADHKVKRIEVLPGKRLSYQRHARRSEHWFVVRGTAVVTLDGEAPRVSRRGVDRHPGRRPTTASRTPARAEVVFVEVQHGDYFGEDDIVRLEDDYGRSDG